MKLQMIASPELLKHELPKFHTPGSAAIDLRALLNSPLTKLDGLQATSTCTHEWHVDEIVLEPGQQVTIDSGLKIHINNPAFCALILPRSSSGKKGLVLANGTGLIDSDYQGPLLLMLWNRGTEPVVIKDGDRVAQYLLTNVQQFDMTFVPEFSGKSERGEGGFGSTGAN